MAGLRVARIGWFHLEQLDILKNNYTITHFAGGAMLNYLRRPSPVPAPSRFGHIFSEPKKSKNKTTNLFRTNSAKRILSYPNKFPMWVVMFIYDCLHKFFWKYILNTLSKKIQCFLPLLDDSATSWCFRWNLASGGMWWRKGWGTPSGHGCRDPPLIYILNKVILVYSLQLCGVVQRLNAVA